MLTQQAIDNFLQSCLSRNLSKATIEWYRHKLQRFADFCTELPLTPEPVEQFLATVQGAPDTKHAHFRSLRAFYNFIEERSDILNPMRKVPPPRCPKKVMPTLEPVELMLLLNSPTNPRDRVLLILFIDTGARVSEIAGLRWKDIKTETICVTGKTGQREIPISEETRRQLFSLADPEHDYVFMGKHEPLTRHRIYNIVRSYMKKAGVLGPKLGPHRIRHTFGKVYLVAGGDVRSLQRIMGHSTIQTTERYASLTMEDTVLKHHQFTPLRSAHAAAQESLFIPPVVKEAEEIIGGRNEVV